MTDSSGPAPSTSPRAAPSVSAALLLSLLCTGLGQMHCGRLRRGMSFFLLSLLFGPAILLLAGSTPSAGTLTALVATVGASTIVLVVAVVDAVVLARRLRREGAEARGEGRPGALLYALFVIVGLVVPVASALYLRANAVEAFYIPTGSMSPTLLPGDRILVDKAAYLRGAPRRGDVAVFRDRESGRNFIKRVVALPGDRVEIRDGAVRVNGNALPRSPAPEDGEDVRWETNDGRRYRVLDDAQRARDVPESTLASGEYFLLGDHRALSDGSMPSWRVAERDLVGPATYVFWPARSWSRFGVLR